MIKTGDILICRGSSWISKAIMKVTRGNWSHACIVAETWGQQGVIEAQSNGVNFKLWDVWTAKWGYHYEVFRYNDTFDEKFVMIRAFNKCGETKYDWFTFFRRAFGNRKQRNESKENKRYICSEFVAYVWAYMDDLIPNAYQITPDELYNHLKQSDKWTKI